MKLLRLVCFTPALAALALSPTVRADSADPRPAQNSYAESIDVRVVNVEAVVTDRRGNRVQGLKASDFRLLVDGKEVPVDYFTEVSAGETAAAAPAEPGAPAPAVSATATATASGKVGTSYLVFIDESFSIAAQRDVVLRRLLADLGRLGAGDQMAVVAFDGKRIDLLTNWTGDRDALRRTFEEAQKRPTGGLQRLAERRSEGIAGDLIVEPGVEYGLFTEVESAISASSAAMRGVTPPPGRKVLLLLSGGWPAISSQYQTADLRHAPSILDIDEPEDLFRPVTETANLLGYTIYPVDVQGLDPESSWASAEASLSVAHGFITADWERGVHQAMEYLAGETGGKAVLNSARLNAFERVEADTRTYYWLGFTPEWRADGKRHDIRVEVRRPGTRVRARGGFSDFSRETQAGLQTESLLLFGGDPAADRIRVTAGEPRRIGLWKRELPVTLEIPAGSLTPLPVEGGYEAQALLSMGSLDDGDGRARLQTLPLRLTLPEAPKPGTYARYETTLKLPTGKQRVVFSVEDTTGGGRSWAELEVH
ncbi:MAG TPA: VWA domain-containing protein [Thermoanaerobaculia bacterium]|jgi:VWFA-related protein|nr:VWA domain-containing protein [Thermoanaerobaculia bacterium]